MILRLKDAYGIWQSYLPHFPKSHRFTIGSKIDEVFLVAIEYCFLASYSADFSFATRILAKRNLAGTRCERGSQGPRVTEQDSAKNSSDRDLANGQETADARPAAAATKETEAAQRTAPVEANHTPATVDQSHRAETNN